MTILKLLQQGCTIEFPSGYILQGDPENGYIDTKFDLGGHIVGDGLRTLDKEGVRLALNDEKRYAKKQKTEEY